MTTNASTDIKSPHAESTRPQLDHPMGIGTLLIFLAGAALRLFFAGYGIFRINSAAGTTVASILPSFCSVPRS